MKNVINFLERLGKDAQLKNLSAEQLSEMVNDTQLSDAVRLALQEGNVAELEQLLDTRHKIICYVVAPTEPEQQPSEDEPDENGNETKVSNF